MLLWFSWYTLWVIPYIRFSIVYMFRQSEDRVFNPLSCIPLQWMWQNLTNIWMENLQPVKLYLSYDYFVAKNISVRWLILKGLPVQLWHLNHQEIQYREYFILLIGLWWLCKLPQGGDILPPLLCSLNQTS